MAITTLSGEPLNLGTLVYKSRGSALAVVENINPAGSLLTLKYVYSVGSNKAGNLETLPVVDGKCAVVVCKVQGPPACMAVSHDHINCYHQPTTKWCVPCKVQVWRDGLAAWRDSLALASGE